MQTVVDGLLGDNNYAVYLSRVDIQWQVGAILKCNVSR